MPRMLRDPIGGAATNLVPAEVPADLYQEVADVVVTKLRAILSITPTNEEGEAEVRLAHEWLTFAPGASS